VVLDLPTVQPLNCTSCQLFTENALGALPLAARQAVIQLLMAVASRIAEEQVVYLGVKGMAMCRQSAAAAVRAHACRKWPGSQSNICLQDTCSAL
jgi:ABC-type uncharacterized transport system YnjBCD permease subunit